MKVAWVDAIQREWYNAVHELSDCDILKSYHEKAIYNRWAKKSFYLSDKKFYHIALKFFV
jgi:hypothetical protein